MALNKFYKCKGKWDELNTMCKSCTTLYYKKNREKIREQQKQSYENNPEKKKNCNKKWKKENREKVNEWERKRNRKRYSSDPIYRLKCVARARLRHALKEQGIRKSKSTLKYLKCSWDTLKKHIEIQFQEGMTWKNQGSKWHIDHRIPLAAFKTEKGVEICSWYRNMQPLWGKDNLSKGGRYKEEDKLLLIEAYIAAFPQEKIEDVWNR